MINPKRIRFVGKVFCSIALLFVLLFEAHAQTLPRRVYLGIRMENLTDDARNIMGLGNTKGVLISDVFAKSTAEAAGFKKGDVLLSVKGTAFGTTSEVITYLGGQKVGDSFNYEE